MQFQSSTHNTSTSRFTPDANAHAPGRQETSPVEPEQHRARRDTSRTQPSRDHAEPIVDRIRSRLVSNLGANRVRRYLSGSVELHKTDNGLSVTAGDTFTLDMIERRVGDDLRSALRTELGLENATIDFNLRPSTSGNDQNATDPSNSQAQTQPLQSLVTPISAPAAQTRSLQYRRCPTLGEFIVGKSNRIAFEAIRRVVQDPTQSLPTFLHGTCGVGKTHLLRAAADQYRKSHPGARVRYTTGEAFTNEYAGSVRKNEVDAFKKKYRKLDLLCIDDIHLMGGKSGTQTELLQVFNTLSLAGSQIMLASDAHPREIKRFNEALVSRFASGVVVRIDTPDAELARKLVIQQAGKVGLRLDDAGISTILERVGIGMGATARDLEGAVIQIEAVTRLIDTKDSTNTSTTSTLDIQRAFELRAPSSNANRATGPISIDAIISCVCSSLSVTRSDLGGRGRQKKVVLARELCVHLAKSLTTRSTPEIAHSIGRPNHSTVITAYKRIKDKIAQGMVIDVCCTHDGVPISELIQTLTQQIHLAHAGR